MSIGVTKLVKSVSDTLATVGSEKVETAQRIRSAKVSLTKEFLDDLHSRWHDVKAGNHPKVSGPVTLKEFGALLAAQTGRTRPFAAPMLTRFLNNEVTSSDLLEALCSFFGIPSPLVKPRSIAEVEWFTYGQMLARANPSEFAKMLRIAKAKALLEKEIGILEQDLSTNLDD